MPFILARVFVIILLILIAWFLFSMLGLIKGCGGVPPALGYRVLAPHSKRCCGSILESPAQRVEGTGATLGLPFHRRCGLRGFSGESKHLFPGVTSTEYSTTPTFVKAKEVFPYFFATRSCVRSSERPLDPPCGAKAPI